MRDFRNSIIIICSILFSSEMGFEQFKSMVARDPSSANSCLEMVANFYSHQSYTFLEKRMALNQDLHSFYRAFVPVFYETFFKLDKKKKKLIALEKYITTIGGDTHVENFGFIIDDAGNVHLSLNDFDDSTEGVLYLDVFRHYISSDMLTSKMDWAEYRNAYLEGVQAKDRGVSNYVQKEIDSYLITKDQVINSYISSTGIPKFNKLKSPNRVMTVKEVESVKSVLVKKYPKIEIFDQYAREKVDGGSAGMLRFQVLVKLTPDGEVKWLDLKEMGVSSLAKVLRPNQVDDPVIRIKNVLKNFYDGSLDKSISTVNLMDKTFSLKSLDQFILAVKVENLSKKEIKEVALDQAYALGLIHSRALKQRHFSLVDYVGDWENISTKDLKNITDEVSSDLDKLYKDSKK